MGLPPEEMGYSGGGQPQQRHSVTDVLCADLEDVAASKHRLEKKSGTKHFTNDTIFAKIAMNDYFQHFTLTVIVINALWIGVDTEWNHKLLVNEDGSYPLEPSAVVIENIFCVYFTAEVLIRFLAMKTCRDCCRDAWFVFDSLLVTCMILETWVMAIVSLIIGGAGGASFLSNFSALRLLRLLRLTRMARLMRSVPELMTLVKGMVSATKSVFFILLFLILVMYVFAIIFTSIVGDPDNTDPEPDTCEHMFGTIGDALMSLFTNGVLGDNLSATVQGILDFPNGEGSGTGLFLFWLFMVFFAISSMTLLNMLIGVLCEVITQTADSEKDSTQIRDLSLCIEDAFASIDKNSDGQVCEAEWSQIKEAPEVRKQLGSLGVEEAHMDERLDQMQKTIFSKPRKGDKDDAAGLTVQELIEKVIDIRPDKPASALDLEILRAKVTIRDKQFSTRLTNVEMLIENMIGRRGAPIASSVQVSALMPEASSSPLREIPTQLLFHEMKTRAQKAPSKGSNSPPGQGAVSYSQIKTLCSDLGN